MKALSPLEEVSSSRSRESDGYRDSGLDTSHRSKKSDQIGRSVASLADTLGTIIEQDIQFRICLLYGDTIVIVTGNLHPRLLIRAVEFVRGINTIQFSADKYMVIAKKVFETLFIF